MSIHQKWSKFKKYSIPSKASIIGSVVGGIGVLLFLFPSPGIKFKRSKILLTEGNIESKWTKPPVDTNTVNFDSNLITHPSSNETFRLNEYQDSSSVNASRNEDTIQPKKENYVLNAKRIQSTSYDSALVFSSSLISVENNTLNFILSNPNSEGLFVVDSVFLDVLNVVPYKVCGFFDGPHAFANRYIFNVKLVPGTTRYLVNNDSTFKYPPNEIDKFIVQITSDEKCLYEIRLEVNYYNPISPDKRYAIFSSKHYAPFPEVISLKELVINAQKIKLFLNDYESIEEMFIDRRFFTFSDSCDVRYIFSTGIIPKNVMFFNRGGQSGLPTDYRFIPKDKYIEALQGIRTYGQFGNQYIVFDDSLLIAYIGYGRGEVISDSIMIHNLLTQFNYLYNRDFFNEKETEELLRKYFRNSLDNR